MKKNVLVTVIRSLVVLVLLTQPFLSGCEEEIEDFGSLYQTEKISIRSPKNDTVMNFDDKFEWSNTNLQYQDTHYVSLALFLESPVIEGNAREISNMDQCIGGARSGGYGLKTYSEASLDSLYRYSPEKEDFISEKLTLEAGETYYWLVWALDDYGNLAYSSKICKMTMAKQ